MPADIISGVITFLQQQIPFRVWDGEVPRQDEQGVEIDLDAGPVWKLTMLPEGLGMDWNMEDTFKEDGPLLLEVFAASRAAAQAQLASVFPLLADSKNWQDLLPQLNPPSYVVRQMILERWTVVHIEGARTRSNQLIYHGQMHYQVGVNGSVPTR
jgi:hypothetical protein